MLNNIETNFKIIGIDLAGKPENPTGICFLDTDKIKCCTVFEDNDILNLISSLNPSLIVIDAPLSLPEGRCCLSNKCACSKVGGHFRKAEVEMRKYGRTLPLTFRGMRMLTQRGIRIADKLKGKYEVIESHPRTIQKICGLQKTKFFGFRQMQSIFLQLQNTKKIVKDFNLPLNLSEHEIDAALLLIAGINYYKGKFMEFGDKEEGIIILPKNN